MDIIIIGIIGILICIFIIAALGSDEFPFWTVVVCFVLVLISFSLGVKISNRITIEHYLEHPEQYQIDTIYTITNKDTVRTFNVHKLEE